MPVRSKFMHLISLWITPLECKCSTPIHNCQAKFHRSLSEKCILRLICLETSCWRSPLSAYSRTICRHLPYKDKFLSFKLAPASNKHFLASSSSSSKNLIFPGSAASTSSTATYYYYCYYLFFGLSSYKSFSYLLPKSKSMNDPNICTIFGWLSSFMISTSFSEISLSSFNNATLAAFRGIVFIA